MIAHLRQGSSVTHYSLNNGTLPSDIVDAVVVFGDPRELASGLSKHKDLLTCDRTSNEWHLWHRPCEQDQRLLHAR